MEVTNDSEVSKPTNLTVSPCFCCEVKYSTFFFVLTIFCLVESISKTILSLIWMILFLRADLVFIFLLSLAILIIYSKICHDYRTKGIYGTKLAYVMSIVMLSICALMIGLALLSMAVIPYVGIKNINYISEMTSFQVGLNVVVYFLGYCYFFYLYFLYYKVISHAYNDPKLTDEIDDQEDKQTELDQEDNETELVQEDNEEEVIPENSEHSKPHEEEGLPA